MGKKHAVAPGEKAERGLSEENQRIVDMLVPTIIGLMQPLDGQTTMIVLTDIFYNVLASMTNPIAMYEELTEGAHELLEELGKRHKQAWEAHKRSLN